jgi:hypothetical protein
LKGLGIEFLGFGIETGESSLRVGDEDTSIGSTLHGTEDTGTSRGTGETDIEEALEGTGFTLDRLDEFEFSGRLSESLVLVSEAELGKSTTSAEKSGSVASRPVGETVLDTVTGEFVRVGRGENNVTLELGRNDLFMERERTSTFISLNIEF